MKPSPEQYRHAAEHLADAITQENPAFACRACAKAAKALTADHYAESALELLSHRKNWYETQRDTRWLAEAVRYWCLIQEWHAWRELQGYSPSDGHAALQLLEGLVAGLEP